MCACVHSLRVSLSLTVCLTRAASGVIIGAILLVLSIEWPFKGRFKGYSGIQFVNDIMPEGVVAGIQLEVGLDLAMKGAAMVTGTNQWATFVRGRSRRARACRRWTHGTRAAAAGAG
jgi:hypothetical protein